MLLRCMRESPSMVNEDGVLLSQKGQQSLGSLLQGSLSCAQDRQRRRKSPMPGSTAYLPPLLRASRPAVLPRLRLPLDARPCRLLQDLTALERSRILFLLMSRIRSYSDDQDALLRRLSLGSSGCVAPPSVSASTAAHPGAMPVSCLVFILDMAAIRGEQGPEVGTWAAEPRCSARLDRL